VEQTWHWWWKATNLALVVSSCFSSLFLSCREIRHRATPNVPKCEAYRAVGPEVYMTKEHITFPEHGGCGAPVVALCLA
jgi:hypothetical protein